MLLFPAVLLLIALLVPNLLTTGRPEWFLFIILHLLITFGWAWEKHRSKSSRSHRQYPEEFLHGDLNATANGKEPWTQPWAAEGMEAVARCPICETAERKIMHADLTDNVFRAAPGKWSLWQCKNCRSAYLDPRPTPNTIHKAYTNYYTHQHGAGRDHYAALHPLRKLRRRLVNGYTNWRFGTRAEPADMLGVLVAFALPSFKKVLDRQYRHLPKLPKSGGVLLDLGCGNGSYLSLAHSCGWQAVGLDPDPEVVANATRQGLTVHQGGIEYFEGQRELFDVITLDHVIEQIGRASCRERV